MYVLHSLGIGVIERKTAISFAWYSVSLCVTHLECVGKKQNIRIITFRRSQEHTEQLSDDIVF